MLAPVLLVVLGAGELNELNGGVVRTVLPCRAIRGLCAQQVSRYFSTHYICILQALNWVRPCAWVRLPFPRHLVSPPVRARRSVGWALVLPEISTMGPRQGIFISMCGCGSLTGPRAVQSCPALNRSWGLPLASRGIAWHDPDDSQTFMRGKGAAADCLEASQARIVITVLSLCLSA